MNLVKKSLKKHIFYLDALRALAILSVIIIHIITTDHYLLNGSKAVYGLYSPAWFLSDFLSLSFNFGVVIFLMLAGALSLGKNWEISIFLRKRIPRILSPFLFWGFIFASVIALFVLVYPDSLSYLMEYSPYHFVGLGNLNLHGYLTFLYNYYMSKSFTSYAYWFFWMMFGVYLIMPVFDKWIFNSDLAELEYFLCFWLITAIFDFTLGYHFPIKLTYFVSPIGFVVLGYYLRFTDRRLLNNPYFDIILILAAVICQLAISYCLSTPNHLYKMDRYNFFNSIEAMAIFLLFKNFKKLNFKPGFLTSPEGAFRRTIASLAKNSYGIYLTHYFILIVSDLLIYTYVPGMNFFLRVVFLFVVTTVLSWALIEASGRISFLSDFAGSK